MTVREMVRDIRIEVIKGNVSPDKAVEMLLKLTALLGNISEEILEADLAFSTVLLGCMQLEKKANRARIVAETTPEYRRKREAHDVKDVAVELIRSLRQMLRTDAEVARLAR